MKSLRIKVMMLVLALLPAGAFAANGSHKGDLYIATAVQVAGTQLPAGDYIVKWNGDGPTAQVSIIRDRAVVATVPARVVKLDQKADDNAAEVKTSGTGERTLTGVRFGGKTYALELSGEEAGATASGDSQK
ncbi:MAG TPA: hypothetical protein VJA94_12415 [Candidatus Angelobacter sp.]